MKAQIDVNDREEAQQLRAGLEHDDVRAFVRIVGALRPLSDRAQRRVMEFVRDRLGDATEDQ